MFTHPGVVADSPGRARADTIEETWLRVSGRICSLDTFGGVTSVCDTQISLLPQALPFDSLRRCARNASAIFSSRTPSRRDTSASLRCGERREPKGHLNSPSLRRLLSWLMSLLWASAELKSRLPSTVSRSQAGLHVPSHADWRSFLTSFCRIAGFAVAATGGLHQRPAGLAQGTCGKGVLRDALEEA